MRTGSWVVTLLLVCGTPAMSWADPCETDMCKAGCADPCWINSNETNPTQGVAVHWGTMPVKYKINASRITAGLDKTQVIDAVKKAFAAWDSLPCSTLKFEYDGESTSFTEEAGKILVYWDYDATYQAGGTWTHNDLAYFVEGPWATYADGELTKGIIGLNSTATHPKYKYDWSLTPQASKFDISLITWLIPVAAGFYVGNDQMAGSIPLFYNKDYSQLCQSHKDAAALAYDAGGTCTKPAVSQCFSATPPDGIKKDSGPPSEGGVTDHPSATDGPHAEGGIIGEGSLPPAEDDGCCRVGHARGASIPYLTLLGLGLLLLIGRRRRR